MAFQGMDPEAVRGIAARLGYQAEAVEAIAQAVDSAMRSALQAWPGGDADDFHGWWVNQHRPSLLAVVEATRTAAQALQQQVDAQLEASGEGPSTFGGAPAGGLSGMSLLGAVGSSLLGAMHTVRDGVEVPHQLFGLVKDGTAVGAYLATHALVGSYPKGWNHMNGAFSIFRWKQSPTLHAVQRFIGKHERLAGFLPGAADNLEKFDKGISFLSWGGVGLKSADAISELRQGQLLDGSLGLASATADALKTKPGVLYLGGMALESVVQPIELARSMHTDFSLDAALDTWHYIGQDPGGALAGAFDGLKKMPGVLVKIGT